MSDIQRFEFHGSDFRITDINGDPWFVGRDACDLLNISRSQLRRLDDDEKGVLIVQTPGGPQEMTVISEAGLFALILTSRKPDAKEFKRWVTHDVLPSIRRTGTYDIATSDHPMVAQARANLQLTERFVQVERELAEAREERARIEAKADMALEDVQRMTLESFIGLNG